MVKVLFGQMQMQIAELVMRALHSGSPTMHEAGALSVALVVGKTGRSNGLWKDGVYLAAYKARSLTRGTGRRSKKRSKYVSPACR